MYDFYCYWGFLAHFENHGYYVGCSPRVIRFTSPSTVRESYGQGSRREGWMTITLPCLKPSRGRGLKPLTLMFEIWDDSVLNPNDYENRSTCEAQSFQIVGLENCHLIYQVTGFTWKIVELIIHFIGKQLEHLKTKFRGLGLVSEQMKLSDLNFLEFAVHHFLYVGLAIGLVTRINLQCWW
jgi:hypothetical protein